MILLNIAHEATLRGHTVRFTTASDMLSDPAAQESSVWTSVEKRGNLSEPG